MGGERVQQIIERYDKALAGAEDATISRVHAALDASYLRLEKELLKAYQKHSDNTNLVPRQRLLLILDELGTYRQLLNPSSTAQYEQAFQALIQQASEMGVDLSGQLTQAIANETLQTFAAVPLDAVRFQAQESAKRLYRWSEEYQQKISGVVEMHLAVGSGPRKVARALRTELGIVKSRAETVARTEVLSSLNQAAQANYKANGIEYTQFHSTAGDLRTCPYCVARNMSVYKMGESTPPIHPRCLIAGTVVDSPTILAGTSREYTGEVIVIETASGKKLTATPNHPVLSNKGWIALNLLKKGDSVFSCLNSERVLSTIAPNNNQSPVLIEEIVAALRESPGVITRSMKIASKDFHRDGEGSKVCVISADRLLWDSVQPQFGKPFSKQPFKRRLINQALLLSDSLLALSLPIKGFTSHGFVGIPCLPCSLLWSHLLPLQRFGLRLRSHLDSSFNQPLSKPSSTDTKLFRQNIFGFSSSIFLNGVFNVDDRGSASNFNSSFNQAIENGGSTDSQLLPQAAYRTPGQIFINNISIININEPRSQLNASKFKPVSHAPVTDASLHSQLPNAFTSEVSADLLLSRQNDSGSGVNINASLLESLVQGRHIDSVSISNCWNSISSLIFRDEIINIERKAFSGHVYNLETQTGWYFANNILTHNCRCFTTPWKLEWQQLGLTNDEWSRDYRYQAIENLKSQGKPINNGLSPFEKAGGRTEPPKPVWTPGQKATVPITPKPAKSLPENHVVSVNPRYSAQAFDEALDQIQSPGAAGRVQQLRQFVNNQGIQVVIHDQTATDSRQLELFRQNIKYQKDWDNRELRDRTIPENLTIDGFTGVNQNHIVVSVGGNRTTFAPQSGELERIAGTVIEKAQGDAVASGVASSSRTRSEYEFIVYLHEMGHQVHYAAGKPDPPDDIAGSATDYGSSNEMEWFAEHFALWMLDADEYRKLDPVGADFVESTLKRALSIPRRLK